MCVLLLNLRVAVGVQFPAVLNPVHLGLYYQRVKARFPKLQVQPPVSSAFETFGASPIIAFSIQVQPMGLKPRMWFVSEDENSLIQLQTDRLIFNWLAGLLNERLSVNKAISTVKLL
jgi:uncharacterized protein (TIGR04255 family)